MVLAHPDVPAVPSDLEFLPAPGEIFAPELPDDIGERVLVAVDCATERRMWAEPVHEAARLVINIDHHQDNTRFGDLNLIEPEASSTAEVLVGVLDAAGLPLTRTSPRRCTSASSPTPAASATPTPAPGRTRSRRA